MTAPAEARTIIAKYPGECRAGECARDTRAIREGEYIKHAGPGLTAHAGCPDPDPARVPPPRPRPGRRGSYGRSRYTRPSGARRYGRCEDAPCCGCCD